MNPNPILDVLRAKMAEQPLVKKYANTVATAVAAVVAVLWTVISVGVNLPDQVVVGGLLLASLGTVVGVKFTPNGVTDKQIDELEAYTRRNVPRGE
ncbi:putative holin [uncultured Caudovirales phage]|uniref:Putative holin n=1 Tax=uncultured Caudovirales phage TaxID=2100421 RepID=A0A2H4JC18_9CAUD|nr:putative holin [uncultured Caudovirales phage]